MNKRIYVVNVNDIPDDRFVTELSDEEFKSLSFGSFNNVEGLINAINNDAEYPCSATDYLRLI